MRLGLRKTPVQGRSKERLALIMQTAEDLILDKGLTEYSVRQVLRKTKTSIATFYQFFPNKKALVRTIVEKYANLLSDRIEVEFTRPSHDGLRDTLGRVQNTVVDFYMDHPVTLKLWPGVHADDDLSELDHLDTQRNVVAVSTFLSTHLPDADSDEVSALAHITVVSTGTVARNVCRLRSAERQQMLRMHLDMIVTAVERCAHACEVAERRYTAPGPGA